MTIRKITILSAAYLIALSSCTEVLRAADGDQIPRPNIPDHTFKITDYGTTADGKTLDTAAIQKTIDACMAAGGGHVVVPAGNYLTAPIHLASNLDLHFEKGATLILSDNIADYKIEKNSFENCITADDAHDLSITGEGTIDGQGAFWWRHYVRPKVDGRDTTKLTHRPFIMVLKKIDRLLVQDVTFKNSPSFHLVPQACQNVVIERAKFSAPDEGKNTDALDPSGWNYLITGCTFDVGDDNIAIKAVSKIDPDQPSCKNFLVTNCTFLRGHGMSIGGQTNGGLDGLVVRDCTFDGTDAGIRLKAGRDAGGLVQNCLYENLTMKNVKVPIFINSYYPSNVMNDANSAAKPVTPTTPIWKHIQIRNVTISDCPVAGKILGLAEMPVEDVVLDHVTIAAKKGMEIVNAKQIQFMNSSITAEKGPAVIANDAEVTGIDFESGKPAK